MSRLTDDRIEMSLEEDYSSSRDTGSLSSSGLYIDAGRGDRTPVTGRKRLANCCRASWRFVVTGFVLATFIVLMIYVNKHHRQLPFLRDSVKEVERAQIITDHYIHANASLTWHSRALAVSCGEPCRQPVDIEYAIVDYGKILIRFPSQLFVCSPCKEPILYFDQPLEESWWPLLGDHRYTVHYRGSDIVTTHMGWLDITEYGVMTIRPQATDWFPADNEYVRFLVPFNEVGWYLNPRIIAS